MKILVLFLLVHSLFAFDLPQDGCKADLKIHDDHYNVTDTYHTGDAYPTDAHYDDKGNLFYVESGRNDKGFYFDIKMLKDDMKKPEKIKGLPNGTSYSIALDKKADKVYFGTSQGIFVYNYETHSAKPVSEKLNLNMIFVDKDGNKYITENSNGVEELYLLDGTKKIRFHTLEALNELGIDDKNNFYFIKEEKLYVLKNTLSTPVCIGNVPYDGIAQISFHKERVFVASENLMYLHENEMSLKEVENVPGKVTAIAFKKTGDFILGVPGKMLKYKKNECYLRNRELHDQDNVISNEFHDHSNTHCDSLMSEITVHNKEVRRALRSLDVNKASGPDGIPARLLRYCAPELSPVLTRLYRLSLVSKIVPKSWKLANVQPVPKKGSRADPSNYRPIAITSVLCKVMERVLNCKLLSYLEDNDLLSDCQYGFRRGRSTGDLLVYVTHCWGEAIENHGEAIAVSLDISKAFDRVWHASLLSKLPAYGIPTGFCSWVADFLSERSIRVVIDGCSSDLKAIDAGVPQGSVLSATLFLLHINDLLSSGIVGYADDSTVTEKYLSGAGASGDEIQRLRKAMIERTSLTLSNVSQWGEDNLVSFNASKTQACLFSAKRSPFTFSPTFRGTSVPVTNTLQLLGMELSSDLNFGTTIESKAQIAARKLGVLNKVKRYFTPEQLLTLYKAQVRSCMEYCCHLWDGSAKYQLAALDSVERRAKRLIGDKKLVATKLHSLAHRRKVACLSVFYRLYFGECARELHELIPPSPFFYRTSRRTAGYHPFLVDIPTLRTKRFKSSFIMRTAKEWNSLPASVFPSAYNLNLFKSRVNRHLLGKLAPP